MASAAATTTASTAGGSGDGGDMIRWGILGTAAIAHKVGCMWETRATIVYVCI